MGLECTEEYRKKHPKTCYLLDFSVGAVFARMPTVAGVGNAALDPAWTATGVSEAVRQYNLKMVRDGKDDQIDPTWAGQHPVEALRELKRRGYGLIINKQ